MLQSILIQAVSLAPEQTRLIISMSIYIGIMLLVASSLNFVYGYAGIPFLGNALPAYLGGMTAGVLITRLTYFIAESAGVRLLPYQTDQGWMLNSEQNAKLVTGFLEFNPALCIALIMFTLSLAVVLGAIGGWLISRPALRLRPAYLMMTSLILASAVNVFGKNILALSGGTMGIFLPDLFAFYNGDRAIPTLILTFIVVLGVFYILSVAKNSRDFRLLRAIHEDELAPSSSGLDVTKLKGKVILLGSGLIALTGALNSIYYLFLVEGAYASPFWETIPLFMIIVGGLGSQLGTVIGVVLIAVFRYMFLIADVSMIIPFPISHLEDLLFALIIFAFLILVPRGIFYRRSHLEPMVGYVPASRRGRYDGIKAKYVPTTIKDDTY